LGGLCLVCHQPVGRPDSAHVVHGVPTRGQSGRCAVCVTHWLRQNAPQDKCDTVTRLGCDNLRRRAVSHNGNGFSRMTTGWLRFTYDFRTAKACWLCRTMAIAPPPCDIDAAACLAAVQARQIRHAPGEQPQRRRRHRAECGAWGGRRVLVRSDQILAKVHGCSSESWRPSPSAQLPGNYAVWQS
jgi:hypothetical protein